jgi:hypothetical protein
MADIYKRAERVFCGGVLKLKIVTLQWMCFMPSELAGSVEEF